MQWVSNDNDESETRRTAALIASHVTELDEWLPRPQYVWRWTNVVDRESEGEGLKPSVAWKLYGGAIDKVRPGWFRVTGKLWEYLEARYPEVEGRNIGVRQVFGTPGGERFGENESRLLVDPDPPSGGLQVGLNGSDVTSDVAKVRREQQLKAIEQASRQPVPKHEAVDDSQSSLTAIEWQDTGGDDGGKGMQASLDEFAFTPTGSGERSHEFTPA